MSNTTLLKTIDLLNELEKERRVERVDFEDFFTMDWELLEVENFGRPEQLYVLPSGYKIARHAWWELCAKIKAAIPNSDIPAKYLWDNPRVVRSEMQRHVDAQALHHATTSLKRAHNDVILNIHGNVITAIFSTNYVDYSNATMLTAYANALNNADSAPTHVFPKFYDPYHDQMQVILTYDRFTQGTNLYSAGVLLRNSQNGTFGVHSVPMVKSQACDNSILSFFGYHKKHTVGVDTWFERTLASLDLMVENSVATYYNYMKADNYVLENPDEVELYVKTNFRLTKPMMARYTEGLHSERDDIKNTLFNLISAITYTSQYESTSMKALEMRLLRYAAQLLELVGQQEKLITTEAIMEIK
jgi:hypothetical protein